MAVVHGFKDGLGEAPLNQRPGGGDEGFPSGHTAAAIFGASAVIRDCAGMVPLIGPAAALAAGLVGASRIETERHDSLQVLVGAAIGLAADRALRRRGERRAARLAFLLGWRVVLRRLAPLRRLRGTPAG
jgi:membrane-associated phospholipid phosphatase